MKHTSKLLTALLLTMAFLVSALPVHGIHAEPETATVQKKAELVFVIDSTGSMSGAIKNVKTGIWHVLRRQRSLHNIIKPLFLAIVSKDIHSTIS